MVLSEDFEKRLSISNLTKSQYDQVVDQYKKSQLYDENTKIDDLNLPVVREMDEGFNSECTESRIVILKDGSVSLEMPTE